MSPHCLLRRWCVPGRQGGTAGCTAVHLSGYMHTCSSLPRRPSLWCGRACAAAGVGGCVVMKLQFVLFSWTNRDSTRVGVFVSSCFVFSGERVIGRDAIRSVAALRTTAWF